MNARLSCCLFSAAMLLILSGPLHATAQETGTRPTAPTESVTVTGIKDVEAAVSKFVETMTVPTHVANKLARWKEGICPTTTGLRPEAVKIINNRIRDIAAQVGAPVNDKGSCQPNIEIVFTTAPQALLDNVRVMYPFLLGYHDNSAQAERLATVTRPIQSWYSTVTEDLHGNRQVDAGRINGPPLTVVMPGPPPVGGMAMSATGSVTMTLPNASSAMFVTGSRLGDGLSSGFNHVVIVAEPAKLLDYELGTLADYIAMLALSQIQQPDTCQDLRSILNLLASGCSTKDTALTSSDFAYLRALYKVTATANFRGQRDEMMYQMNHSLGARQ
jgi:hypothetical protein